MSGQYAANFIQGFEHAKEAVYPLQASTCCKHFVCVASGHLSPRTYTPAPLPARLHTLSACPPFSRPQPPPPSNSANELEAWNGTNRNHVDVFVPQQDLVDSYLPSFQTCVEEGKASGIMCSYVRARGMHFRPSIHCSLISCPTTLHSFVAPPPRML